MNIRVCLQTVQYLEIIALAICESPCRYKFNFVRDVFNLCDHLRFDEHMERGTEDTDPEWFVQLKEIDRQFEVGKTIGCQCSVVITIR